MMRERGLRRRKGFGRVRPETFRNYDVNTFGKGVLQHDKLRPT